VVIVSLLDNVSEVKGFKLLSLLIEIARVVFSVFGLDYLPGKDKSFVVVMRLLLHIIL
jgi:hypothetical protein